MKIKAILFHPEKGSEWNKFRYCDVTDEEGNHWDGEVTREDIDTNSKTTYFRLAATGQEGFVRQEWRITEMLMIMPE